MKRNRLTFMLLAVVVFAMVAAPAYSRVSDDYRVIKRAVKKGQKTGEVMWFKLLVVDKKTKKQRIKLTMPLSLVEWLSECSKDSLNLKNHCSIDLRTVIKHLKKTGPMILLEAEEDDELVKIWFE